MMDIFYKYSGLMSIDFFNMPTIKISVPEQLNDPYESRPSENIRKAIEYSNDNIYVDNIESSIRNMIITNGIISLSETQRNSLMWAHYAQHHKGMCIGFEKKLFKRHSAAAYWC
ncbi:DUF2971 domain-containing protein [Aeromonas veronii]|uniref:DUF2971 domain-containing protein n=1 Tax=Aeromonas veronii TaxID=654 RepID=UPI0024427404|nr:DUF2971 domain-containing protein [Aeromonas veronii]